MKILILAAGYATRLFPMTLNNPKSLLEVGKKPILEHIFEKILQLEDVKGCFIVTNKKFYNSFKYWAAGFKCSIPVEVVNDETTSNDDRLGAIGDMEFVVKKKGIKDDLLVIGGDNIFEFSLRDFVDFSQAHKPNTSLALFDIKDKDKAKLYGVVKIDQSSRVIGFAEKPPNPDSTLIATCVYYFPEDRLNLLSDYLSSTKKYDASGNYIKWLSENEKVFGFVFKEEWYDIGDFSSYREADKKYKEKK